MAKITEYPSYTSIQSDDLLLVVANVANDPASKKVKIKDFLSNIQSNTSIIANFTVDGDINVSGNNYTVTSVNVDFTNIQVDKLTITSNGFIITDKFTPANSSISEDGSEGKIQFDDNYIYVKTANNVTKRVALSSF